MLTNNLVPSFVNKRVLSLIKPLLSVSKWELSVMIREPSFEIMRVVSCVIIRCGSGCIMRLSVCINRFEWSGGGCGGGC
jgi:hypothetical protein